VFQQVTGEEVLRALQLERGYAHVTARVGVQRLLAGREGVEQRKAATNGTPIPLPSDTPQYPTGPPSPTQSSSWRASRVARHLLASRPVAMRGRIDGRHREPAGRHVAVGARHQARGPLVLTSAMAQQHQGAGTGGIGG
jgi:hypothetical protein